MHELGITRSIVSIAAEAASGKHVRRITLEIGKLSGVMSEAIEFCFDTVARGTVLEGAVLEINLITGRSRCDVCGAEFDTPALFTACPCGSRRTVRLCGEELKVKSIELMEAS